VASLRNESRPEHDLARAVARAQKVGTKNVKIKPWTG
jgi:hypothetical protein